jgi:hypothetical protein
MASGAGHAKSHTAEVQTTAKDQVLKMDGRGRSAEKNAASHHSRVTSAGVRFTRRGID